MTRIAAALLLALSALAARAADDGVPKQLNEKTIQELQQMMASGKLTSVQLTRYYIERIIKLDQNGPGVNSVIELNPDALSIAAELDEQREHGHVKGPLHGIPVLLKDNIDTGDKMQTAAGSFALFGKPAPRDSTVAANLRAGGAVILGKTNLSEWANFRSFESFSGWSGRGGMTHNAYFMDHNACGSSSGSGAAASANFAAVSFGTETDGSIVCPGNANGVVAIKPTVGLTSRAGVVPITHVQDTVGPHARTVADAAAVLSVAQSRTFDGRDPATGGVPLGKRGLAKRSDFNIPTDYTKCLNSHGLQGTKIGVSRAGLAGFGPPGFPTFVATPPGVLQVFEDNIAAIKAAGATVIDLPDNALTPANGELLVLLFDFRRDLAAYIAESPRTGVPIKNLNDAIAFNSAHAAVEMPFFTQDIFLEAASLAPGENDPQSGDPLGLGLDFGGLTYNQALDLDQAAGTSMDKVLGGDNPGHVALDAIVSATDNPAWANDFIYGDHFVFGTSGLAAGPGYPIVQVPSGNVFGVPTGISFFGSAFSECTLINLASGFEAATNARAHNLPKLLPSIPDSPLPEPDLSGLPRGRDSSASRATVHRAERREHHHM